MIIIKKTSDTDLIRTAKNSNGGIVDLTTATFSCDLRETPTSSASVSLTPANVSATLGLYKIPIASTHLTALSNRTYYCRVAITVGTADYDDSFYLKILGNTGVTITAAHTTAGTTANRPTLTSTDVGFTYFDTTLNSLIVWSGSAWVVMAEGSVNYLGDYTSAEILLQEIEGTVIGDWYFNTDLNSPYFWNGTNWV